MIARVRAVARFWYEFIIGDDWRVAVGVVAALAVTTVLAGRTTLPLWWVVVGTVAVLLPWTIGRAVYKTRVRAPSSSSA